MEDGVASPTEGHAGVMIDREEFAGELEAALLSDGDPSFVAEAHDAPLRIDEGQAAKVADRVTAALASGASLSFAGKTWQAGKETLGAWVTTDIEQADDGSWSLVPSLDADKARPALLAQIEERSAGTPLHVTFDPQDGGEVLVRTDGATEVPQVSDAVEALSAALFGGAAPESAPSIDVASAPAPAELPFEEAVEEGIVGRISSYTTEYLDGAGTENRRHNIHLVADYLSNSVAKADGGTWSFNDTAGNCNEERGFLGAGAILDGTFQDAVGGGICQVATTVFNAVYDAGFPVVSRSNHSLYIASYPAGRDAAVSWPDLDFVWRNDSASDVLMRTSYTDTSITVTLYGVDPGYQVSTQVGDWEKGQSFSTRTERDNSLAPGTSYVKTAGADGATIDVYRTVRSAGGAILHEDVFHSEYTPVTEVVVAGAQAG